MLTILLELIKDTNGSIRLHEGKYYLFHDLGQLEIAESEALTLIRLREYVDLKGAIAEEDNNSIYTASYDQEDNSITVIVLSNRGLCRAFALMKQYAPEYTIDGIHDNGDYIGLIYKG